MFALVKLTMSDDILCQPPLLVYPHSLLQNTERFWNNVSQANKLMTQSLDDARAEELLDLATNLERDYPHLSRGARYLRSLCDPDRHREPCCRLHFVEAGPQNGMGMAHVQLGRPAPPPKPHRLQVVFHHRAG